MQRVIYYEYSLGGVMQIKLADGFNGHKALFDDSSAARSAINTSTKSSKPDADRSARLLFWECGNAAQAELSRPRCQSAVDLCGVDGMKPPKALEQIADVVLNYRPKSKQPKPRKRKKKAKP
jgi:hypothetical protein